MRPDIAHDFDFGRRFLTELKQIAGRHLIGEAPFEEDTKHATDLIVLRLEAVRIACRVRRPEYLDKYGDEFTLRCSRPNGLDTELAKIIAGWGDYLLYAFAASDHRLAAWALGDLCVFRRWHARHLASNFGELPGMGRSNPDGTRFRAYRIHDLPSAFVVARQPGLSVAA